MNCTTNVVQVTNVSPNTTSEQMRMLFGFLGTIEELKLFPPDQSPLPVTSRVCFVKFQEMSSVGASQHLTNTVFLDRALIVVPFAEGVIPEEAKALSLLAPANAVAGILPGGGLLPTPNPMSNPQMGGNPFGSPSMDAMAAFGFPNPNMNMNPQLFPTEQLLKFMSHVDPKMNHMGLGMNMNINMNPGLKVDSSNKKLEEAMKRVREAQSLISAAIEPGNKESKRKNSRSRSKSRRRRSRSRSRHRRSKSRSRRHSKSPRRRSGRSHSKDGSKPSPSKSRKKEERDKKHPKTPPKSYSTTRRSRSIDRRRRRSRSASPSPKKRNVSRTPSPRRHEKEKKKDRERQSDKDRSRDERKEKKVRIKDKEKKEREKEKEKKERTDGEKGDVKMSLQVTRKEHGYDSEESEGLDEEDSDQD